MLFPLLTLIRKKLQISFEDSELAKKYYVLLRSRKMHEDDWDSFWFEVNQEIEEMNQENEEYLREQENE